MSKEEYLALEKYPQRSVLVVPARRGGYYADSHLREGFIEGYHQAEKDNELTWKDVRDILNLYEDVIEMDFCEDIYGEVLKRFKDFKERKQQ